MNTRWTRLWLSGGLALLTACAAQSAHVDAAAKSGPSRIALQVETTPHAVQIELTGDSPLVYTAFRLPEPPRLIIDLAGVRVSDDEQPRTVNHGAVTTVTPLRDATTADVARIEIGLTELVDYQLRPDGARLVVTIKNPGDVPETADAGPALSEPRDAQEDAAPETAAAVEAPASTSEPATTRVDSAGLESDAPKLTANSETPPAGPAVTELSAVTPQPDSESEAAPASIEVKPAVSESPPAPTAVSPVVEKTPQAPLSAPEPVPDQVATVVTGIRSVVDSNPLQIEITGNGQFHPQTMLLSGPRLVIDLPGTEAKLRQPRFPINASIVKQVRVGQHRDPKKVRLVFDLTRAGYYHVRQVGTAMIVSFSDDRIVFGNVNAKPIGTTPAAKTAPPTPPAEQKVPLPAMKKPAETRGAQMADTGAQEPRSGQDRDVSQVKQYTGQPVSLDFQDAPIDNILRLMADVSGLNIVVGEGVKGNVTVKLINVPWDQALELILKTHGLGQVREGNILRIDTLANLSRQQDEEARAKESATKAEDLVTKVLYVNYAEAKTLAKVLEKTLSPRGEITIDDRTNALIVKDVGAKANDVAALLKVLDLQTPQVLIEARVVSADTSFARDLGVQWGGDFKATRGPYQAGVITGPGSSGVGNPTTGFLVNLPASGQAGSLGNIGFTLGRLTGNPFSLDLRLSAGEAKGVSKTISAPKIAVLDNQQAKIEQGTSIPFQTTSQQGTQTTFVDANLVLEVTPHVTPDGSILMDLRVANNEPDFVNVTPAGPPIKKKEAKTNILVKDGETAVIGGIYVSTNSSTVSGVPWFYKIPILGWLFKQEAKSEAIQELLVFLTPRILT